MHIFSINIHVLRHMKKKLPTKLQRNLNTFRDSLLGCGPSVEKHSCTPPMCWPGPASKGSGQTQLEWRVQHEGSISQLLAPLASLLYSFTDTRTNLTSCQNSPTISKNNSYDPVDVPPLLPSYYICVSHTWILYKNVNVHIVLCIHASCSKTRCTILTFSRKYI